MIPLSQVTLLYSIKSFKFRSPVRTYLKTNEIKERQMLHKTLTAKLTTQISRTPCQVKHKITRRLSIQCNDRTQQLWETLHSKIHSESYDQGLIQEFFFDLLKDQNFIGDYEFPLTCKQSFTKFKSYFMSALFYEASLPKYMHKLENLRMPHLQTLSIHQELKGFQGLNQLLEGLYNSLKKDITIREYLVGNYEDVREQWVEIATQLLQPQDLPQLYNQIYKYSEENHLNHVHYSNFKHVLYRNMIEMKISKRGIKKVLKIVDSMKSAVMRCDRVMDLVKKNYQYFLYCMVSGQKNETFFRRAIELILEYLYNNELRSLKKQDLKHLIMVHQPMYKVISRLNASQLLIQDFQQDLNAIFSQRIYIKHRSVVEFCNQLKQIPFFMQLYDDYEVQVQGLLETELDFVLSNRTYFRRKEIELIHCNMNISNEVFDLYLMRLQDCLQGVPTKAILSRLEQYRSWVVKQ